jgi:hypothetical protein
MQGITTEAVPAFHVNSARRDPVLKSAKVTGGGSVFTKHVNCAPEIDVESELAASVLFADFAFEGQAGVGNESLQG